VEGYEIHAGQNVTGPDAVTWVNINGRPDGIMNAEGNVLGSYLHGLFDDGKLFAAVAGRIREMRGDGARDSAPVSMEAFREREFDRIAAIVRSSVHMDAIYRIMDGEDVPCGSGLPL
jgi:adenosylcobyric acid synthase